MGHDTCSVRRFGPGDVLRVAQLAGQLGYPSTPDEVVHRLRAMEHSRERAVFVAERASDQIVGWIGIGLFRCAELDSFAEISGFVVDEHSRSCGIGGQLLTAAEQWARSMGSSVLCVSSNAVRERAHRFYQNHGFEQVKIQKVFRKTLG